jgi:hypothetical protein
MMFNFPRTCTISSGEFMGLFLGVPEANPK